VCVLAAQLVHKAALWLTHEGQQSYVLLYWAAVCPVPTCVECISECLQCLYWVVSADARAGLHAGVVRV
jgi:hypothetical protein